MDTPEDVTKLRVSVSATYTEELAAAWGDPKRVAEAAMNELFNPRHDLGLDHDDQVGYATKIGILAGRAHEAGVSREVFTYYFVNQILSDEHDDDL